MSTEPSSLNHNKEKFAIIKKYLNSGLTQINFCKQEGLEYSTFHYWLKKYREANKYIKADTLLSDDLISLNNRFEESTLNDFGKEKNSNENNDKEKLKEIREDRDLGVIHLHGESPYEGMGVIGAWILFIVLLTIGPLYIIFNLFGISLEHYYSVLSIILTICIYIIQGVSGCINKNSSEQASRLINSMSENHSTISTFSTMILVLFLIYLKVRK